MIIEDIYVILWNVTTSHRLTHDHQVSCSHECQVASMHVSKLCYICMCSSIDEPFLFNDNLRHICQTLVLIANTSSISSYFPLLILFFTLILCLATTMAIWTGIPLLFTRNFSFYILVYNNNIKWQEYVCVLGDLECLTTKFMVLEQGN